MAILPSLSLTLTQRKLYTGASPRTDRLAVQAQVVASAASGVNVAAAFVIGPSIGAEQERLVRILNLDSVPDQVLVADPTSINPLQYFKTDAENITARGMSAGDTLRVTVPPGEWDETGLLPATQDFIIDDVDLSNQRIKLRNPFLWSAVGVTWDIFNTVGAQLGATGTSGYTQRFNPALLEWRADRFTSVFDDAQEALNHMAAIQGYVRSLANQVKLDPTSFITFAPGNPVVNTY